MKKLLSILGAISLITSGSSNLISCNNTKLTTEELTKLKAENSKTINGNKLEWIAPQEKPFNTADNKWYVIVWRGEKNDKWRIVKLIHNELKIGKIIDKYNQYTLELREETGYPFDFTLYVRYSSSWAPADWESDNGKYFKSVYRWDGTNEPPVLNINSNGEIEN